MLARKLASRVGTRKPRCNLDELCTSRGTNGARMSASLLGFKLRKLYEVQLESPG